VIGRDECWARLLALHAAPVSFACAAVSERIIVTRGRVLKSAEVYDEVLDPWLHLRHALSCNGALERMEIALV